MKKMIKNILCKFGIIIMKRSSRIYLPEDESYRIVLDLCSNEKPVVIDGGAHKGSTVEAFFKICPHAEFHCFEPDTVLASDLKIKFIELNNVFVVNKAIGDVPGNAMLNINASRPTNSLLPTADNVSSNIEQLCQTIEQQEVEVITIDAYCETIGHSTIDIIKLDLQGYDYQALLGAAKTIKNVKVVLTEVLFTEIYKGSHLFPDIMNVMADYGFKLYTLSGIHYGNSNELLWADAIFINQRIINNHP